MTVMVICLLVCHMKRSDMHEESRVVSQVCPGPRRLFSSVKSYVSSSGCKCGI